MSPMALGYNGQHNVTSSGKECITWEKIPMYLRPTSWQFDQDITDARGYCRNPDADVKGPWCYVSLDTYRVEYCDIPYCGKDTSVNSALELCNMYIYHICIEFV